MLDVCAALSEVLGCTPVGPMERVELVDAAGRVLREPVVARMDVPPFTKALMDGFAVRSGDLRTLPARLTVIEEIPAGATPRLPLQRGACAKIMTGAPLPEGADAVVRVEDTAAVDESRDTVGPAGSGFRVPVGRCVVVLDSAAPVEPGRNALPRGAIMRSGASILMPGRRLRAQEIAVLGECGMAAVPVGRRPTVAILSTGDELVPVDAECGPGEIRNSNEAMLAAQILEVGGRPVPMGIAPDDRRVLAERIAVALEHDFVLLSGGVSAGERDFVPGVLAELGVRRVFHKVHLKPGKPLWFGIGPLPAGAGGEEAAATGEPSRLRAAVPDGQSSAPDAAGSEKDTPRPRLVFGLPGNPVSSMVCCELFVKPALRRWMGLKNVGPASVSAVLVEEMTTRGDRPTYHPARLECDAARGAWQVLPTRWLGSADLLSTTRANALLVLPPGERRIAAGTLVEVLPLGTEWWNDAARQHCAGHFEPPQPQRSHATESPR